LLILAGVGLLGLSVGAIPESLESELGSSLGRFGLLSSSEG